MTRALFLLAAILAAPAYAYTYDDLDRVNWEVNKTPYSARFNCRQFAIEKIIALGGKNILGRYVSVLTETGEHHAIVVVDGVWALDNRRRHVVTVHALRDEGYLIP